jgi:hypothetical protein
VPRKQHAWTLLVIGIAGVATLLSMSIMLFQLRGLSRQVHDKNDTIEAQSRLIIQQTDINQQFLKCLILVPADKFQDVTQRAALVEQCSKDSKTPRILPN